MMFIYEIYGEKIVCWPSINSHVVLAGEGAFKNSLSLAPTMHMWVCVIGHARELWQETYRMQNAVQ